MSKERLFQLAAKADEQLHSFYSNPEEERRSSPLRTAAQVAALGTGAGLAYHNRAAITAGAKSAYGKAAPQAQAAYAKYAPQAKDAAARAAALAKEKAKKGMVYAGGKLTAAAPKVGGFISGIGGKLAKAGTMLSVADVERVVSLAARIEGLKDFSDGRSAPRMRRDKAVAGMAVAAGAGHLATKYGGQAVAVGKQAGAKYGKPAVAAGKQAMDAVVKQGRKGVKWIKLARVARA